MKKLTLALVAAASVGAGLSAQAPPAENAALRQQIERRFEVLVLSDRLLLRPRSSGSAVRVVELGDSTIVIDGSPATGQEVRDKLGADADAVFQLNYMTMAQRRALFGAAAAPSASTAPVPPAAPAPPAAPDPSVAPIQPTPPAAPEGRRTRRGDQVRIGGSVRVDEDELVTGSVVAIGGSARIDGEVRGEVVAVGGNVELGPRAVVGRDITVVGGTLERADGARIQGELHEVSIGDLDFGDWRWRWRPTPRFGRTVALMSTLGRIAVLCVLGVLVMLLARQYVERTSQRAAAEPLKAGAIGFLAQLLFLPVLIVTIVVLIVTLVGIPLLLLIPFALLALAAVALLGFTSIAYRVGQFASKRFDWNLTGPYAPTLVGILAIVSPLLFARLLSLVGWPIGPMAFGLGLIAFIVEYVAWTIGFGAVALARFDRGRPPSAPIAEPPPMLP
jgi:hypothetical protein